MEQRLCRCPEEPQVLTGIATRTEVRGRGVVAPYVPPDPDRGGEIREEQPASALGRRAWTETPLPGGQASVITCVITCPRVGCWWRNGVRPRLRYRVCQRPRCRGSARRDVCARCNASKQVGSCRLVGRAWHRLSVAHRPRFERMVECVRAFPPSVTSKTATARALHQAGLREAPEISGPLGDRRCLSVNRGAWR